MWQMTELLQRLVPHIKSGPHQLKENTICFWIVQMIKKAHSEQECPPSMSQQMPKLSISAFYHPYWLSSPIHTWTKCWIMDPCSNAVLSAYLTTHDIFFVYYSWAQHLVRYTLHYSTDYRVHSVSYYMILVKKFRDHNFWGKKTRISRHLLIRDKSG